MTFSWKFPDCPAIATAVSSPIAWAATIAAASGTTGFTLPGMMLLPGWRAGSAISPSPERGPLFIQRRSFAIFMREVAYVRSAPEKATTASGEERARK
jgi:hypothetical protein